MGTVEAVQQDFHDEVFFASASEMQAPDSQLGSYPLHMRLQQVVAGMPYVAFLAIVGPEGRIINSSRRWPVREPRAVNPDHLNAIKTQPGVEPCSARRYATWSRIDGSCRCRIAYLTQKANCSA